MFSEPQRRDLRAAAVPGLHQHDVGQRGRQAPEPALHAGRAVTAGEAGACKAFTGHAQRLQARPDAQRRDPRQAANFTLSPLTPAQAVQPQQDQDTGARQYPDRLGQLSLLARLDTWCSRTIPNTLSWKGNCAESHSTRCLLPACASWLRLIDTAWVPDAVRRNSGSK